MIITSMQAAYMKQHSEETFLQRVMQFVVEQQRSEANDRSLRPACEALIQRAREFGFSTELEVASFTICGFQYGPDFHTNADLPFRQLLHDPEMDFATKADAMIGLLESSQRGDTGSATA